MYPSPGTTVYSYRPELGQALSELDLAMARNGFIGLKVAVPLEMGLAGGPFPIIPLRSLLINPEGGLGRSSRGDYQRVAWDFDTDSFSCKETGIEIPVDDRLKAVYANFFDAELVSAEISRDIVLRDREKQIADTVMDTDAIQNAACGATWKNHTDGDPITDVDNNKKTMRDRCGYKPNCMVVTWNVYSMHLRHNTKIIDRIASQGAGGAVKASDITPTVLAQVFDIDYFFVADAIRNTAKPDKDVVIADIWSNEKALLCRIAPPGDRNPATPSMARTLHWAADGSTIGATVESYGSNPVRGKVLRARMDTEIKIMNASQGQIITGIYA